ncbi:OB-fold nucleic acid binding domain-containing protein [Methanotorris formicicus]|uniref:Uncharacterized protein n=1 Tax=Methanotorris formicicus Mc-S-70 TaxID=647171 RepID=H1KXQ0_9EURY|nr:OB-fold nucleic acid binding domain-containing protein [Methanotorris formicicus]EHP88123.1 hypothetical protein MetfoDRAFT_0573 [Methanotorris formicicus Mc-S-70]
MVKYENVMVVKTEVIYGPKDFEEEISGNYTLPIEANVTFDINGYHIEAFVTPPIDGIKENERYIVNLKIMTYDLEIVDVPKKQKLIYQITTNPDYVFVGEVLEIDRKKKKIIFDCGVKLEADWDKIHEETVKKLKEGDWIFIKGKMFGDIEE